jgi:iron(II)-dependent oxidoreductase
MSEERPSSWLDSSLIAHRFQLWIPFMRIFISYSRKDVDAANALSVWLEARGADVFIDYQEILGTDHFPERLAHEIEACDVLLLLLSPSSVQSRWVRREVEYADELQKATVIVQLEAAELPKALFYLGRHERIDGRALLATKQVPPALQDKLSRTLGVKAEVASDAGLARQARTSTGGGSAGLTPQTPTAPRESRTRFMGGIAIGLALVGALAVALLVLTRQDDPTPFELTASRGAPVNETVVALGNMTATQSQALFNATQTIDSLTTIVAQFTPTLTPTSTPTPEPPTSTPTATNTATPEPEATPLEATNTLDATLELLDAQVAILDSQTQLIEWEPQWEPYPDQEGGVEMVKVPAGCFMMGGSPLPNTPDEAETFPVCLDAFWLDRYEVYNEQFSAYGGSASDGSWDAIGDHPRTGVTWLAAVEFCALRGARLPTEAEWEYAARGPFSHLYPWGDEFISEFVNDDLESLVPVYEYGEAISWVGAFHMVGNAGEWTSSRLVRYPYDANDGREEPPTDETDQRVIRGGDFLIFNTPEYLASATRLWGISNAEGGTPALGFRCARDA